MIRSLRSRFLWIAAGMLLAGSRPLLAAPVVCPPGEPDFVYEDVGSDGCFNSGVDTQIPDSSLLGTYAAPAGSSIVVPPGVSVAPDPEIALDWTARSVFVRGKVKTEDGSFIAKADGLGHHELVGSITVKGTGTLTLTCTALCLGSIFGTGSKLTADGNVAVTMRVVIEDDVSIVSKTGTVGLYFSSIGADFDVEAAQAVTATVDPPASVGTGATFISDTSVISVSGTGSPAFVAATGLKMAGGGLSITGPGSIQIGDGAKLTCTDVLTCQLSNGSTRILGNDVKFVAPVGGISITGSGDCTIGDRVKLVAGSSGVNLSNGGGHTIGNKAKISSESSVSISSTNDISLGTAAKIKGSSISLSSGGARIIGAGAKLTASSSVSITGSGANTIGDSVKITAGTVNLGGGSAAGFGNGNSIVATSGSLSMSFGGLITIGTGAKLKGHGVSVSSGAGRSIGVGAKFDAIDGTLSISSGGATTFGAGAKLSGSTISVGHAGDLTFDPDSNASAGSGGLAYSNGGNTTLREGAKIKSIGPVNLSNSGSRTLEAGTKVAADGSVSIQGGTATVIGDGVALTGASFYVNGDTITVGDKVGLKTDGSITFAGPSHQTFGEKLKLKSLGDLNFTTGGNIIFGEKPLLSASNINASNGSAMQFGDKAKLKALGSLTLNGNTGVNLGLGAKLVAGSDLTIQANAPTATTMISDAKMKSGTQLEEMDPASVLTIEGYNITIVESALAGADSINQITITPQETMMVDTSKITGKTITVGSNVNAPFSTFEYTADTTKGSDDPSTITFQATGTNCVLTASVFKNITADTTSCASVVGP